MSQEQPGFTNNVRTALEYIGCFLNDNFERETFAPLWELCLCLAHCNSFKSSFQTNKFDYNGLQDFLSKINEREEVRKNKGVYYTSKDVVDFILISSIKAYKKQLIADNIALLSIDEIIDEDFIYKTKILEPTCGAGEFLLAAFELKVNKLKDKGEMSKESVLKVIQTIHGNDINPESIIIAKLRLFLSLLHICGVQIASACAKTIEYSFNSNDFVNLEEINKNKYDIIIGNPPYVEDSKYGKLDIKFGNIYCNVLNNSTKLLSEQGVIGFIVPLSFTSTPRMKQIREILSSNFIQQFILNYADRPDCLFPSVHQKLCIVIAAKKGKPGVFTSKYQYWYKEERELLFKTAKVVHNPFSCNDFIPKLGEPIDISIYKKITESPKCVSIYASSRNGHECVYVNRRETFWVKAYRALPYVDPELKVFRYTTKEEADYCYCLVNSSLFWWYWVCTSDCWHISKTLNGFKAPQIKDFSNATQLAKALAHKLEETKLYVGTRQVDYEYKHNLCVDEIHAIDDFVNKIFELTKEESDYIKQFSYKYRISGGPDYGKSN